jgi:hypothetical protein
VRDPLFSLVAMEGDAITRLDLARAPGFVLKIESSSPSARMPWSVSQVKFEEPDEVERILGTISKYLDDRQLLEVMDGIANLSPEFAAAIATLKFQRYGIVRASNP